MENSPTPQSPDFRLYKGLLIAYLLGYAAGQGPDFLQGFLKNLAPLLLA